MSRLWDTWKHWIAIPWVRWAVLPVLLLVLVFLVELLGFHAKQLSLPEEQRGKVPVTVEQVRREALTDQERGYTMTETDKQTAAALPAEQNIYRIRVSQGYTNKLAVEMKHRDKESGIARYTIKYHRADGMEGEGFSALDGRCILEIGEDYTEIGEQVDTILVFTDASVRVTGAALDNTLLLSGQRMLWMYAAALTAYLLVAGRRIIGRRLEIGFLIVGLATGLVWVAAMPINTNLTWDDGIHFGNADALSYGTNEVDRSQAEYLLTNFGLAGHIQDTQEDQAAYIRFIDELAEDTSEQAAYYTWELCDIGYTTQSLGIALGRALGLPFHWQFILGRMGNMLLYIGVCYAAIKVAVQFKAVMATIALFPTVMSMACSFAYDPTVIAFSLLGCSLFIAEMSRPDKRMDWKRGALMLAAFCIASFPKAVYIPMILLLLFLPKTKFADRRAHISFKVGVGLIFIIMMSSFVVPVFFVKGGGDVRGGNGVNTEAQLKFILSNPVAYAKVLVKSVLNVLDSFVINDTRMLLPYLSRGLTEQSPTYLLGTLNLISTGLMFYVLFTDKHKEKGTKELKGSTKWWMLVAVGGIVVLIWTALYLSFTAVGSSTIAGVQGRYYIPLFLLAAAILSPRHIKNETNPVRYNGLVLGLNALILFGCIWVYLIASFWL